MVYFHLFLLSVAWVTASKAQMLYSRKLPYDPMYAIRRIPSRRSVDLGDRFRLPITRYFPQVDTQMVSAPLISQQSYSPAASLSSYGIPSSSDDVYALPPQWADALIQLQQLPSNAMEMNEDEDYGAYDYDNDWAPVYAEGGYVQDAPDAEADGDLYNDLMVNYVLRGWQPRERDLDPIDILDIQRRSQIEARDIFPNADETQTAKKPAPLPSSAPIPSTTEIPPSSSSSSEAPSPSPLSPSSSPLSPPLPPASSSSSLSSSSSSSLSQKQTSGHLSKTNEDIWRPFTSSQRGQKEFPLFRPGKSSQQSTWASLEEQLSRAKNNNYKSPIPLINKLMAGRRHSQGADALTDQLDNLKQQKL